MSMNAWIATAVVGLVLTLLVRGRIAPWLVLLPVMATSAFINNSPVVAAFIPLVTDWARKFGISGDLGPSDPQGGP
jgi:Na+/H+ antiporter NhaD/arsenite permease-like protein